jgi:15-cis-phytoene synthase
MKAQLPGGPAMRHQTRSQLEAAGITAAGLQGDYERARQLNAAHGKTYYLATLLLPPAKRPYVHALYGFARYADDIVDDMDPATDPHERGARFETWSEHFLQSIQCRASDDPIIRAVIDTITHWHIPASYFADFLRSMRMDLTVTQYATYDDLAAYMWGSAAVIGLEMLPILESAGHRTPSGAIRDHAIELGTAFQLTNFIRDLSEDLARGRIYLPQDSLAACDVDRARLERARATRTTDRPIRDLMAREIARARDLYRSAAAGIELVHPSSRDCLRTAAALYGGILDVIEAADYDVFSRRAAVPLGRRARVAGAGLIRARRSRSAHSSAGTARPTAPPEAAR